MTEIAHGRVQRKVELLQTYKEILAAGNIASTAIGSIPEQYSVATTVGASAVEVMNKLIDPGIGLGLKRIQVELSAKFTYLGSAAGSLSFYWDARSEWFDPVGTHRTTTYVNLTGTTESPAGSAVNNAYEFIHGGYLDVGSLPQAPIRLRLIVFQQPQQLLTPRQAKQ